MKTDDNRHSDSLIERYLLPFTAAKNRLQSYLRYLDMNKSVQLLVIIILGVCLMASLDIPKQIITTSQSADNDQWQRSTHHEAGSEITIISGFKGPYGITYHEGKFYVPDIRDARVIEFDSDFTPLRWLGFAKSGNKWHSDFSIQPDTDRADGFKGAHAITFLQDNRILVTDYFANRIAIYSSNGKFQKFMGFGKNLPSVSGVANATKDHEGNIWVVDFDGHKILKFDPDLKLLGCLGYDGTSPNSGFQDNCVSQKTDKLGGFFKPHMVAVTQQGDFFVVETGNNRVQFFTKDGIAQRHFGSDSLHDPVSLFPSDNHTFLIADNGNHRIVKISQTGEILGWFGGSDDKVIMPFMNTDRPSRKGKKPGFFAHPFHAIDANGSIIVADGHNNRVLVYQKN